MILRMFFILGCFCMHGFTQELFPKKVWLYWDESIQKAPYIIRLLYQKFVNICSQQNWQLTLLHRENLQTYISDYKHKFQDVIAKAKTQYKQNIVDLIRLTVLQEHGGVYFDISSIPVQGLRWIQQIRSFSHLLTNVKSDQFPDVLIPYIVGSQSVSERRQLKDGSLFNLQPAYEGWFIAAKPRSPAIIQWLKWFIYFYTNSQQVTSQQLVKEDIYLRNVELVDYLSISKGIYYFLQVKQKQLDQNLTLFKSERNYAFHFYKIWGFHAEYGPFAFYTFSQKNMLDFLFLYTLKQIKQNYIEIHFFVKFSRYERPFLQKILNFQIELAKNSIDFNRFLSSNPTLQNCRKVIFPVEDSVIGNIIKGNKFAQQLQLFTISFEQRQSWTNYCSKLKLLEKQSLHFYQIDFQNLILQALQFFKSSIISSQSRIYETKLFQPDKAVKISITQAVWILYKNNQFVLKLFIVISLALSFSIIFLFWLMNQLEHFATNRFYKLLKVQAVKKSIKHQQFFQWASLNRNQHFLMKLLMILSTGLVMSSFEFYDKFGDIHSDKRLFFTVLWVLTVNYYLQKKIALHDKQFDIKLSHIQTIVSPFLYFELGKQLINWMQVRHNSIFPDTVVNCLIFPAIIKVINLRRQSRTNFLNKLMKFSQLHSIIIVLFMVTCLTTNLRFILFDDTYLVRNIPQLWILYVGLFYLGLLISIFKQLWIISFKGGQNLINKNTANQKISPIINQLLLMLQFFFIWCNFQNLKTSTKLLSFTLDLQTKSVFQFVTIFYFILIFVWLQSNGSHLGFNFSGKQVLLVQLHIISFMILLTLFKQFAIQNFVFIIIWFIWSATLIGSIVRIQWRLRLYLNQEKLRTIQIIADQNQQHENQRMGGQITLIRPYQQVNSHQSQEDD